MDAMRFDYFDQVVREGQHKFSYEPVWSTGYETGVWYRNTWNHNRYNDTVLISGTPIPWRSGQGCYQQKFFKSYPLWKEQGKTLNRLLSLKDVFTKTKKISEIHKNKRILLHIIPPHLPYYHEEGMKWLLGLFGEQILEDGTIYHRVQEYGRTEGWNKLVLYYKLNIKTALDELLKHDWGENGVISSDHGELIGEGNLYTHSGKHLSESKKLRIVPWINLT